MILKKETGLKGNDNMTFIPRAQEIYRHFKGNLYQIVTLAEHTESGEKLVVYQAMYGDFKVYARPLTMFCSKVDREKYPHAEQEYRFELQNIGKMTGEDKPVQEEVVQESVREAVQEETVQEKPVQEEPDLDPMLLAFLDAETYAEKLNILAGMHHRITDDMITTMAIASDVEIEEGDLENRYMQLKNCLQTLDRYEISRPR